MVPRINSLPAPNRKQIHCCQGMPAHQLPSMGGAHEGQVARSSPKNLTFYPYAPMQPNLPPNLNICPSTFLQVLNYHIPCPLLSTLNLVFWTILNLQAATGDSLTSITPTLWFLHTEVPWSHPHSLVEVLSCPQ